MKRLLLLFGILSCWVGANAQAYTQTSPNLCVSSGVDTLFYTLNQVAPASGAATVTFYYQGDLDGGLTGNEYFRLIDENDNVVGVSNCTGGCTTTNGQCLSTQDSVKFTISQSVASQWTTDGSIDFKVYRGTGVSQTLCTNPGSCAQIKVEYTSVSGSCPQFTNFKVDSITGSGAKVSWTPGTGNSSFYLEYGTTGFTPGSGTSVTGTYPGAASQVILTGLSALTSYDIYFGEICNSGVDSVFFPGALSFMTTRACAAPDSFQVSNVLANSADFSWISLGNPNSFNIIYGQAGFNPATTGGTHNALNSPTTIIGLNGATDYEAYLYADCGATDGNSDTIGPIAFRTPCVIVTAPFTENFDGPSWVASGNNANNQIDPCWTTVPDETQGTEPFKWIPRSTGPTSGNGPLNDATGSNFMYVEASGSAAGDVATLTSPVIDVSGLTSPALYFMQHRFSNGSIADMDIEVSNDMGASWSNVYNVTGDIQSASSDPWINQFVNLGAYIGDTIMIRFTQTGNGCCGDAAIDSVVVGEAPACPDPGNFTFVGSSSATATFSWTDPTGSAWNMEYGLTGFTQGAGTVITTSNNPHTITGLTASTTYDIYLRTDCSGSGNGTSNWIGPITFNTQCNVFVAPFTENFDGPAWVPRNGIDICWSATPAAGSTWSWEPRSTAPTSGNGPLSDFTGGNFMYCEASLGGSFPDAEFTTPLIDVSALTTPALYFKQHRYSGATIADMRIEVSNDLGASWDTLYTITGDIQTSSSDPWLQEVVNLGAYTGDTVMIKFLQTFNGCCGDAAIDSIVVDEAPLCPDPGNFTFVSSSTSSATLSWLDPTGSSWDIEYGLTGFVQGAGTTINTTTNPHTLTGLTASTIYDAYIRTNCTAAGNGSSNWIGPITFNTQCTIFTAPYQEDFDGSAWVASGNNANNQIDPCWSSNPDVTQNAEPFKWIPRGTGPTSGNGPLSDATGGNFMYAEASGSTAGDIAYLTSPLIDVSGLTTPALYFMQHRFSNGNIADLDIEVSNDLGATWNNVYNVTGDVQTSSSDPWIYEFINLAAYAGDTINIRFVQTGNGCCGDAALDSIVVDEAPTCPWPTNVNITSVTDSSAVLAWDDPTGSTWQIEWGPTGYAQGTGVAKSTTSNPDTLMNLASNTVYDVYIRTDCSGGGNGFSIWIGPITFRTDCSAFTAPYSNNFDNDPANIVPICWDAVLDFTAGTPPVVQTYLFVTPNSPPNHVRIYGGSATNANGDTVMLISPQFSDLTGSDKRINFYAKGSTAGTTVIVGTMADKDDATTFHPMDTITLTNTHQFYVNEFTAASGYNGTDEYIAFMHGLDFTFRTVYIDDFVYEAIPACNPPLLNSLGVAGTGVTTSTVFWGSGSDGDETHIEWGAPGFIPGTGSALNMDSVPGTTDTFTITGLTAQTTYEFYIRDSCAVSGFSPWIGPISFTTACTVQPSPFFEDFDGTAWVASGNNAGNQISVCWSSSPDVTQGTEPFKWIPRGTGPTSGNGPLSDLTGGNFMYAEASGSSSGDVAFLTTPIIDVSNLNAPALYFWQHRNANGGTIADMDIEVSEDFGASWTTVYSVTGQIQTSSGAPWVQEIVNLPTAVGDTVIIRFIQNGNGCCGDAAIDSVAITEGPTCPDPVALSAANVIDTAALLTWLSPVQGNTSQVWFGPQGFFQGTTTTGGVKTFTSIDSLYLDTLSPNTCYEFLIKAGCGPGDSSNWVGPVSFCTPCQAFNTPYLEDYNVWPLSCWDVNLGSNPWAMFAGPAGDNYAIANFWNVASGNYIMRSPLINIQNNSQLSFEWSHLYSATYPDDQLIVRIMDVAVGVWDTLYDLKGPGNFDDPSAGNTNPGNFIPLDTILDSATYTGKTVQVEFYANSDFGPNLYVNDFYIGKVPTCFEPTNLAVANITTTTASVSWVTGGATNWEVLYGNQGFVPGSGAGTLISPATNPQTLTGLSPSSTYDVYVRDSCGPGDVSFWAGPISFATNCAAVMAPYMEQFAGSVLPNCYDTYGATGTTGNSIWKNTSQNWPAYGAQGVSNAPGSMGFAMGVDGSAPTNDTAVIMETVEIDITNLSTPTLSFKKFQNNIDDPLNMTLYVDIFDGANWNMGAFSNNLNDTAWVLHQISLSQFTITGPIQIAFRVDKTTGGVNSFYGDIMIDDVVVDDGSNCAAPDSLNTANLACTTADLVWISYNGGASIVEYGPAGFTPGMGTGTIAVTQSPFAISGLTPGTAYEYYVADTCASDTSSIVGPFAFTTPSGPISASFTSNINSPTNIDLTVDFNASGSVGATSYTWIFGDGTANGSGMMVSHIYTQDSAYTVTLIVTGPCGSDTVTQQVVVNGIGMVESALSRSLDLYPNPASDKLNLSFDAENSNRSVISLLDLSGKVIMVITARDINNRYSEEIDISQLAKGTYILKVESGDYTAVRRVVKE